MLNAGDKVAILLSRRDEIRTIDLTVANEPTLEWRLYPGAGTTDAQKRNLQDWLAVAASQ
jgi:predicted metalloprotease with PDZ domain